MKNIHGYDYARRIAAHLARSIGQHCAKNEPAMKTGGKRNTLDAVNENMLRDIGLGNGWADRRDHPKT